MQSFPVFDGHNDILYRIAARPENREHIWLANDRRQTVKGHLDLPRMKSSGFAGGFFAVYIPSDDIADSSDFLAQMDNPPYVLPLPDLIPETVAAPKALALIGHLLWMERVSGGAFRICKTVADLKECLAKGIISAILHFEGAEPIGQDLDGLYSYHAMGLRSLGPVWSRPTVFGHGVPFAFPSSPDTGPGLTEAGKDLVRACNELKIMLDLSHLNETGFWDVARLSKAPLVATHSNAHAICPSSRNLTDRQLAAIAETKGMVGLNFATCFLRPDGRESDDMTLEPMLRHLDHLITHLGEDHVGFGSDFDGATTPRDIGDVTGLARLQSAMQDHGYSPALMRKLCHENWFALLERTWGA